MESHIAIIVYALITAIYLVSLYLIYSYFRKKNHSRESNNVGNDTFVITPPLVNIIYDSEDSIDNYISELADMTLNVRSMFFSESINTLNITTPKVNLDSDVFVKYNDIKINQLKTINY